MLGSHDGGTNTKIHSLWESIWQQGRENEKCWMSPMAITKVRQVKSLTLIILKKKQKTSDFLGEIQGITDNYLRKLIRSIAKDMGVLLILIRQVVHEDSVCAWGVSCLCSITIIYIYIRGVLNKFPDFFVQAFKIVVDSWKFTMLLLYIFWWLTNFYDFKYKWTATAVVGIHPTKTWFSHLVNFINAIWTWYHFWRTICNKILL